MKACKSGGHVDGHHKPMKHKLEHHRAKGGSVEEGPDEPLKKGGAAKKKHHAHHAHGGAAKPRMDKRARGGKINSPSHPLSGAAPTKMRPEFSEKQNIGKSND